VGDFGRTDPDVRLAHDGGAEDGVVASAPFSHLEPWFVGVDIVDATDVWYACVFVSCGKCV